MALRQPGPVASKGGCRGWRARWWRQPTDGATADQTAAADNGPGDWLERASSRPGVERAGVGVGDKLELERESGVDWCLVVGGDIVHVRRDPRVCHVIHVQPFGTAFALC